MLKKFKNFGLRLLEMKNINLTGNIKTNNPFDDLSVEELRKLIKSD